MYFPSFLPTNIKISGEITPATHLDPWSCLAPSWPKEKTLIWDKQQGDLLEELRKTCEAGGIPGRAELGPAQSKRWFKNVSTMLKNSLNTVFR